MDVLVVEDEPLVRQMIVEELMDAGFQAIPAPDAETGFAIVEDDGPPPAVVVTDVNLGAGMDGLALADEAARRWPGVAVVVITGNPRNVDAMTPPQRKNCLVKPFEPTQIVARVKQLMRCP
jgi:DNA-binding response OmpR family regulator